MSRGKTIIFLDGVLCPQCGGTLNCDGKEVWCSFVGDQKRNVKACDYGLGGGQTLKSLLKGSEEGSNLTVKKDHYGELLKDRDRLQWLLDNFRTVEFFPSDDSGMKSFNCRTEIDDLQEGGDGA